MVTIGTDGEITPQHYAFLVGQTKFEQIFEWIGRPSRASRADPARTKSGEIRHHDGGCDVHCGDPGGHLLELVTRPSGNGG